MNTQADKDPLLESLRGMRKAEPGPFLFTRIMAAAERFKDTRVPAWQLRWTLAGFALLALINIWVLLQMNGSENHQPKQAGAYGLNDDTFNLY